MTTWLPRRRTSTKPCLARMLQTSRPERVRSLPNLHVERCDVELALEALPDLTLARRLEEEGDRLLDVVASLLDAVALAGNVEFGAQGNVAVPFAVDPGSDMLDALHPFIMRHWISPGAGQRRGTSGTACHGSSPPAADGHERSLGAVGHEQATPAL